MNGGGKGRITRTQLIKKLAETAQVSTAVAKQMVDAYAEIAAAETKRAGEFLLPGIGKLVKVERKARTGRNPATGEAIKIPAKKVVKFRVAKGMKDLLTTTPKRKQE